MPTADGRRQTIRELLLGRNAQGLGFDQCLPGVRGRSEAVKFLEKVETVPGGKCWGWRGRIAESGYASHRSKVLGESWAHRVSYLLFIGPLIEGMEIDHLCRNRSCVNPDHLEQVTPSTNVRRSKPWVTCDRLHPNDPTRVAARSDGREFCRECQRVRERERRAKFAAAEERKSRRALPNSL